MRPEGQLGVFKQLAVEQAKLAKSIEVLRRRQFERVEDKVIDRQEYIPLEEVLRDIFDKPKKKMKKKEFTDLLLTMAPSLSSADREIGNRILRRTLSDVITTEDVQQEIRTPATLEREAEVEPAVSPVSLGPPVVAGKRSEMTSEFAPTAGISSIEPTFGPSTVSGAAQELTPQQVDAITTKAVEDFRAIKGNVRGADLEVIALLRKLDTRALRGSFMMKLTKDDFKAQFKYKPLEDLGFFQSTRGLGYRYKK